MSTEGFIGYCSYCNCHQNCYESLRISSSIMLAPNTLSKYAIRTTFRAIIGMLEPVPEKEYFFACLPLCRASEGHQQCQRRSVPTYDGFCGKHVYQMSEKRDKHAFEQILCAVWRPLELGLCLYVAEFASEVGQKAAPVWGLGQCVALSDWWPPAPVDHEPNEEMEAYFATQ